MQLNFPARSVRHLILPATVFVATPSPLLAQATTRVSVASSGAQAAGPSDTACASSDGRYIAFGSSAANLVPGDSNNRNDVFVHDRSTGQTMRASVSTGGFQATGNSYWPSISWDGRFVAFESSAADLVAFDSNGSWDTFVRDRVSGTTVRVSVDSNGNQADWNGDSAFPQISANGAYVAFGSRATNLVPNDTNACDDIFVHEIQTGLTERVSVDSNGTQANSISYLPCVSADGRYVAFQSYASNLFSGDTNAQDDVFVHDRQTGATSCVSVDFTAGQVVGGGNPSISGDGRYVAFSSYGSTLVSGDTNGVADVFVRDLQLGTTIRVSVASAGTQATAYSGYPSMSANARFVAFWSSATDLVPNDTNGRHDVFVHDVISGTTYRLSVGLNGLESNDHSFAPRISADGAYVTFHSDASNLVPADSNAVSDVFARARLIDSYLDSDADGFGDASVPSGPVPFCAVGYVENDLDCDDSNSAVHPGAVEVCNGIDDDCDGTIDEGFLATYCTAGTTVHGCVPSIAGEGAPSSVAPTGFDIVVRTIEGQRYGTIFYGFYAAAVQWAPFSPSFKCVASPVNRTGVLDSGGIAGQCNGELRLDFNAWITANPGAVGSPFVAGQVFYAQGWFRDPGAPKQTNLSDGLRFTLCN